MAAHAITTDRVVKWWPTLVASAITYISNCWRAKATTSDARLVSDASPNRLPLRCTNNHSSPRAAMSRNANVSLSPRGIKRCRSRPARMRRGRNLLRLAGADEPAGCPP